MKSLSRIIVSGLVITLLSVFGSDARAEVHQMGPGKPQFVVVLDAGHGGKDPGNMGNGYIEKNIALNIVLFAGKILEKRPEIKVVYTRKDDTFVELTQRGAIANQANADLFISVHCDSHTSDAYGAGTFVLGVHANEKNFEVAKKENSVIYLEENYEETYAQYDINSPESIIGLTVLQEEFLDQSIEFARLLQRNFRQNLKRKDRKVKQAGFIVLHQTFMPSVLVETGFLTNKKEGAYLNSRKGQLEMARAMADAVIEYTQGIVINLVDEAGVEVMGNASNQPKQTPVSDGPSGGTLKRTEASVDRKESPVGPAVKTKRPPATVEKKAEPVSRPAAERPASDVIFKVQIMASKVPRPLRSSEFKGLDILSTEKFGDYHRYMYGSTSSYAEALELQRVARSRGYREAYIVVYKIGERVRLTDQIRRKYP
jgi:N-acetylmuramoyl-L-alanine amidase